LDETYHKECSLRKRAQNAQRLFESFKPKYLNSMIIQIDLNYHIETDGFNGVALVCVEKKIKTLEDGSIKGYDAKETTYHPNPKLALIRYFEKTNKKIDISQWEHKIEEMKKKLDEIYEKFAEANWRLK
jgi:hypothetical protein